MVSPCSVNPASRARPFKVPGWLSWLLAVALTGALAAGEHRAYGQTVQPRDNGAGPSNALLRPLTLVDIGLRDGLRFSGYGGARDLFFPVPRRDSLTGATLRLEYESASALDSRRTLQVTAGERTLHSISLERRADRRSIDLPIDISGLTEDFIRIGIRYGGAVTTDRCMDDRLAGDVLTVLPATGVTLAYRADVLPDVRDLLASLPRNTTVLVPQRPLEANEWAAALTLSRTLAAQGGRVRFDLLAPEAVANRAAGDTDRNWQTGHVLLGRVTEVRNALSADQSVADPTPDQSGDGVLGVARYADAPALIVHGERPDAAALVAGLPWRDVLATAAVSVRQATPGARARLTFEQISAETDAIDVVDRHIWSATFNAHDVPRGYVASGLALDVAVAADGSNAPPIVSAFLNDRLLGSAAITESQPTRIQLTIPDGLPALTNRIRVVVQRQVRAGECAFRPQGFPAQLLRSSEVVLLPQTTVVDDFFELSQQFRDGATLILSGITPADQLRALRLLGEVTANLLPRDTPLSVRMADGVGTVTPTGPFILFGRIGPEINTPIRFDTGRVVLTSADGRTLLDATGLDGMLAAQVVSINNQPGLWLRPTGPTLPTLTPQFSGMRLDRGNAAFIDPDGVRLAFSTTRDTLVQVTYPERFTWTTILEAYRPWIIGGVWLLVTILFVSLIQRLYRGRARSGSTS
jgi:hypothetical protein